MWLSKLILVFPKEPCGDKSIIQKGICCSATRDAALLHSLICSSTTPLQCSFQSAVSLWGLPLVLYSCRLSRGLLIEKVQESGVSRLSAALYLLSSQCSWSSAICPVCDVLKAIKCTLPRKGVEIWSSLFFKTSCNV